MDKQLFELSKADEKQTSRQLSVSVGTLRRWRLLNQGPPFRRIGGLIRYDPQEVELWYRNQPKGGSK